MIIFMVIERSIMIELIDIYFERDNKIILNLFIRRYEHEKIL